MRRYETIYILRPNLSESEISTIIDNTSAILESNGGAVINLDKWGMRKLAYEIKKEAQGYYVFCDYASNPAEVAEMERKFRIDDAVLKYLTIKLDHDIDAGGVQAARQEIEDEQADRAAEAEAEAAEEASDSNSDS